MYICISLFIYRESERYIYIYIYIHIYIYTCMYSSSPLGHRAAALLDPRRELGRAGEEGRQAICVYHH